MWQMQPTSKQLKEEEFELQQASKRCMEATKIPRSRRHSKTEQAVNQESVGQNNSMESRIHQKNQRDRPVRSRKWTNGELMTCEKKENLCLEKDDEFNEQSAQMFLAVVEQCTLAVRNKLKSIKDFVQLEEDDDVIGLLKVINELTFATTSAQCEHWGLAESLKRAMRTCQHISR